MEKVCKILTIIVFLFSAISASSQEYWLTQPAPTDKNLRSCFFTDTLTGWIGGDSGLIIHTTDKGKTWIKQNSGVTNGIISMFFLNEFRGYALSWQLDQTPPDYYGTRVLSTSNGGLNWQNYLYPDSNLFLTTVLFLDSMNGYMVGSGASLLFTSDAGNTWAKGIIDSGLIFAFPVEDIKFQNNMTGYASGGAFDIAGIIWKTINGGRNWQAQIVGSEPVNELYIKDSLNTIGVGGDFEYGSSIVRTSNNGDNWIYTELGIFGIGNSIDFRNKNEGWISLGIVDSFLITTNCGNNWKTVGTPNGASVYKIVFIDSLNGWAVGNNGVILKYNSNLVNVDNTGFSIPEALTLFQNYPNPFNPQTIINYELHSSKHVTIKIYDINGKEISTLVDKFHNAGRYNIEWTANDLPSGIYFYVLTAKDNFNNDLSESKKMILLR